MNCYKPARHQRGMTLVELLTTLSLSAILLSIALPSFNAMLKSFRSSAIANEMIGHLIYARTLTVSSGKVITVCGSSDQQNCDCFATRSCSWLADFPSDP